MPRTACLSRTRDGRAMTGRPAGRRVTDGRMRSGGADGTARTLSSVAYRDAAYRDVTYMDVTYMDVASRERGTRDDPAGVHECDHELICRNLR